MSSFGPLTLIMFFFLAGCSSVAQMALRSQAPLFEKGSSALNEERDWDWFKDATPGNIQFMETMLSQDPSNQVLRRTLIRAYAGYAFAVFETLAIPEQIRGDDQCPNVEKAILMYGRAMAHAKIYFSNKDVDFFQNNEEHLLNQLRKKTDEADLGAILFFAQAWGASINLQKRNIALVSQIPRVKLMFDFVCRKKPDIEQGICPLFYAQYEASRPRMLGGNPELAVELFKKFISSSPQNLLARTNYLSFSVITRLDEDEFIKEGRALDEAIHAWESGEKSKASLNLYNAVAKKRWEFLKSYKKDIF